MCRCGDRTAHHSRVVDVNSRCLERLALRTECVLTAVQSRPGRELAQPTQPACHYEAVHYTAPIRARTRVVVSDQRASSSSTLLHFTPQL